MHRPPPTPPLFPARPLSRPPPRRTARPLRGRRDSGASKRSTRPADSAARARRAGELARRYPRGELIVSTPQNPDAHEVDAEFGGAVDRLPMSRRFTKTLPGLLLWSRRATSLARQHRVRFVHCGNVKPAGYPARWVDERVRVPYGLLLYGGDLLSEQHKIRPSAVKRRTARALFCGAGALVGNINRTS